MPWTSHPFTGKVSREKEKEMVIVSMAILLLTEVSAVVSPFNSLLPLTAILVLVVVVAVVVVICWSGARPMMDDDDDLFASSGQESYTYSSGTSSSSNYSMDTTSHPSATFSHAILLHLCRSHANPHLPTPSYPLPFPPPSSPPLPPPLPPPPCTCSVEYSSGLTALEDLDAIDLEVVDLEAEGVLNPLHGEKCVNKAIALILSSSTQINPHLTQFQPSLLAQPHTTSLYYIPILILIYLQLLLLRHK